MSNESKPEQITLDELKNMSPAQIVKARREGRLDDLAKGADESYRYD